MTLNGVGSRTRLVLPAGGPRREPTSRARTGGRGPTERGAASRGGWVHQGGRARRVPRAPTAAGAAPRPRSP